MPLEKVCPECGMDMYLHKPHFEMPFNHWCCHTCFHVIPLEPHEKITEILLTNKSEDDFGFKIGGKSPDACFLRKDTKEEKQP